MSRIGKKPIVIPEGVTITKADRNIRVVGPLGELTIDLPESLIITQEDDLLRVKPKQDTRQTRSLHGLFRTLIANAVTGVKEGFAKELEIRGIGFRATKEEDGLILLLGFSHPIKFTPPPQIVLEVQKNIIKISGIDKQKVGEVAAKIRKLRLPDAYKGKGIRYKGEVIKLKPGKAVKTTLGAAGSK